MAYLNNPFEEEEKKQDELLQQGLTPQAPNGQSAYAPAAPAVPSAQAAPTAPTVSTENKGSGFVGLDKYRAANKGSGEIMAKQVGEKAVKEFDTANQEIEKLDVNAGSIAENQDLLKGISDTKSGLNDAQRGELQTAMGYKAKDALDTSGYDAAYNSAYDTAKSYSTRDVQLAALQDIFNSGEVRKKGITYGSNMAALDASLMSDNGDQIQKAVDGIAKSVSNKATTKKSQFETNKAVVNQSADKYRDKIRKAADEGRNSLKSANQREVDSLNSKNATVQAGKQVDYAGSNASWGDVLDDSELAAASKYDEILGGRTFDNTNRTYKEASYKDIPKPNTDIIIPSPGMPGPLMIDEDALYQDPSASVASNANGARVDPNLPIGEVGTVQVNLDPPAQAPNTSGGGSSRRPLDKYRKNKIPL